MLPVFVFHCIVNMVLWRLMKTSSKFPSALKMPSKNYACFILRRFGLFLIHLQSKNIKQHLAMLAVKNQKALWRKKLQCDAKDVKSKITTPNPVKFAKSKRMTTWTFKFTVYTTLHRSRCACLSLYLKWSPIVCVLWMRDRWASSFRYFLKKFCNYFSSCRDVSPR